MTAGKKNRKLNLFWNIWRLKLNLKSILTKSSAKNSVKHLGLWWKFAQSNEKICKRRSTVEFSGYFLISLFHLSGSSCIFTSPRGAFLAEYKLFPQHIICWFAYIFYISHRNFAMVISACSRNGLAMCAFSLAPHSRKEPLSTNLFLGDLHTLISGAATSRALYCYRGKTRTRKD